MIVILTKLEENIYDARIYNVLKIAATKSQDVRLGEKHDITI